MIVPCQLSVDNDKGRLREKHWGFFSAEGSIMRSPTAMLKLASLPRLALCCAKETTHSFRSVHLASVHRAASKSQGESVQEAIRFSESKAASWNAQNSFGPPPREMPWYQPVIISLSLGVFLLYFLFLREENDMDVELNQTLFNRVPGLEENHLRAVIQHNKQTGKDTADLERRLADVLEEKARLKNA